jgi:Carboxypeptidase regulatory-like domain
MTIRILKWVAPVLALAALALLSGRTVQADDAATTQPSTASGSIVVTVVGSDSNPIAKASVKLYAKKSKSDAAQQAEAKKHHPLDRGKTDDDGKYTFSALASGQYKINASDKQSGTKGSATVSLTDDAPNATVTITLDTPDAGATTKPSPQ